MRIGITCYPTYGGSGAVATELGLELGRPGPEGRERRAPPRTSRGSFRIVPIPPPPVSRRAPPSRGRRVRVLAGGDLSRLRLRGLRRAGDSQLRLDRGLPSVARRLVASRAGSRRPQDSGPRLELPAGEADRRRHPRLRGRAPGAPRDPGARG